MSKGNAVLAHDAVRPPDRLRQMVDVLNAIDASAVVPRADAERMLKLLESAEADGLTAA